jgi:cysteine desulfurase
MSAAANLYSQREAGSEREAIRWLRDRFVEGLARGPWAVKLNEPPESERHPGNANLRFEGFSALDILGALQPSLAARFELENDYPFAAQMNQAAGDTNVESSP